MKLFILKETTSHSLFLSSLSLSHTQKTHGHSNNINRVITTIIYVCLSLFAVGKYLISVG